MMAQCFEVRVGNFQKEGDKKFVIIRRKLLSIELDLVERVAISLKPPQKKATNEAGIGTSRGP